MYRTYMTGLPMILHTPIGWVNKISATPVKITRSDICDTGAVDIIGPGLVGGRFLPAVISQKAVEGGVFGAQIYWTGKAFL